MSGLPAAVLSAAVPLRTNGSRLVLVIEVRVVAPAVVVVAIGLLAASTASAFFVISLVAVVSSERSCRWGGADTPGFGLLR